MEAKENHILTTLSNKIYRVIALYEKTKLERDDLKEKIKSIEEELAAKTKQWQAIQQKNDQVKTARQLAAGGEDTTEVKNKINELVRDIDQCISLLNN